MQNTHSPVDVDLLNDINRLPERQRLTIILNELGAGLAGRGSDLNAVIRRANPALQELDKVLAILASENHVLAKLAVDSDKALAPFARRAQAGRRLLRAEQHGRPGQRRATAARSNATSTCSRRSCASSARRWNACARFAEQTTPAFTDLGSRRARRSTRPSRSCRPSRTARRSSSRASARPPRQSGPALVGDQAAAHAACGSLGAAAKPFADNLAELFTSLRDTGGLERIMDFIFLGAGAANGYDALGHFLRTEGIGNDLPQIRDRSGSGLQRQTRLTTEPSGDRRAPRRERVASPSATSLVMARTLAVIKGATPAQAIAKYPGSATAPPAQRLRLRQRRRRHRQRPSRSAARRAGTTYYTPSAEGSEADGMLLNYLLGN